MAAVRQEHEQEYETRNGLVKKPSERPRQTKVSSSSET